MLRETTDTFSIRRDLYQARLVFWLFLASLAMFFIGCMVAYLLLMYGLRNPRPDVPASLSYARLDLPLMFWPSTVTLLVTSVLLHLAAKHVATERLVKFKNYIRASLYTSLAFLVIQSVALVSLLTEHYSDVGQQGFNRMYGICFAIALIHGLHVLGGVVFIGFVDYRGQQGAYDHERHWAVDHCAWYWHFMDVIWLMMIAMFWFTR